MDPHAELAAMLPESFCRVCGFYLNLWDCPNHEPKPADYRREQ